MKKFLVVCAAAMLCCSLVSAQEAEDTGRGAELSIVPRLDLGILHLFEDHSTYFNLGNTSLYTLFEGNISESWSFSLSNHWVASDWSAINLREGLFIPTGDLYNIYKPFSGETANNFVDWAYITYAPGSFEFSLGKMPMIVGGFEFEEFDVDVHPIATSTFWNSFTVYQPAISASWTTPSEMTTFTVQVSADQFNMRPAYGLKWTGEYGPFSTNWSAVLVNPVDPEDPASTSLYPILSFGNRLTLGDFTLTVDYMNRSGDPLYEAPDISGHTLLGTLAYAPSEKFDISLRGIWDIVGSVSSGLDKEYLYGFRPILQGNWYPFRNSKMLRIQGCAGTTVTEFGTDMFFGTIGMTWNFGFKLW